VRRADRLFRIVQLLRSGGLRTARSLAERLEVSERTIYRDVRDLQLSGMPILGEAGVGYTLRRDLDLPPLMFTRDELTALVLGARLVKAWGGTTSVRAAGEALARIEAVLPPDLRHRLKAVHLYAPGFQMPIAHRDLLDQLQVACADRLILQLTYTSLDGKSTDRTIHPLGLYFWSGVWTLAAWCNLREGFRVFRVDRINSCTDSSRKFFPRRGQHLEDFLEQVRRDSPRFSDSIA
jgi:predicted DNA-binding transcriptional regulator YafY